MKKLIALLLAAVLTFSLVGCTGKSEILGTYESEIDWTDLIVETFDTATGMSGTAFSLENYLDSFPLKVVLVFQEDGTYRAEFAPESVTSALNQLKTALLPLLNDLLFESFRTQFAPYGFTIETQADIEAIVGMTWAELFLSSVDMSAEDYVDSLINESFAEVLSIQLLAEGKYVAKEGKLYLSQSLETNVPEDSYAIYEIDGSNIHIVDAVNMEDSGFTDYPYLLTYVKPEA